jgi:hypothetical protein
MTVRLQLSSHFSLGMGNGGRICAKASPIVIVTCLGGDFAEYCDIAMLNTNVELEVVS